MKTSRLRGARLARGWSQSRLINAIEVYARSHGLPVASTASLGVYVSEWENAKRPIRGTYAVILRAVVGLTNEELGCEDETPKQPDDSYDDLVRRLGVARRFNSAAVGTLLQQTELLRTMDRQLGAATLVDQMSAHLKMLEEALAFSVMPDARRPVARALSGAASLAAWQALDVGATDRAWRRYELAKSAAREAEDRALLAHAIGEQSYVLMDAGEAGPASLLIQEAQRAGGSRVPARLVAWLCAAEAEIMATAGRVDDSHRALDRASAALPADGQARDPGLPSVFLDQSHLNRWRGNVLALLGDEAAMTELNLALDSLDPSFVRAQVGVRCDLAQAHRMRGEHEESARQLSEARRLAGAVGSVRQRRRVERLSRTAA